jgi:hypothetical protein
MCLDRRHICRANPSEQLQGDRNRFHGRQGTDLNERASFLLYLRPIVSNKEIP